MEDALDPVIEEGLAPEAAEDMLNSVPKYVLAPEAKKSEFAPDASDEMVALEAEDKLNPVSEDMLDIGSIL